MSARRLFCSRKILTEGVFTIIGDEAHHGIAVLRLREGDNINVFTEQGSEFNCSIVSVRKGQLKAKILEKLENRVESSLDLILVQALPKAAKLEQIIVHGTELGMTRLVPVITKRSIATGDRHERWRKLALEAAKQSGRRRIPVVEPVVRFEQMDLGRFDGSLLLVAAEPPNTNSLKEILSGGGTITSIVVAVGPEGGFEADELEQLRQTGFSPFSMGPRILRTQTASLAAFSVLQFVLGDWEEDQAES